MAQMTPGTAQTDTHLSPEGLAASQADPRPEATEAIELRERRIWEDFKRKHLGRYYVPRRLVNTSATTGIVETAGINVFHPGPVTASAGLPVDSVHLPSGQSSWRLLWRWLLLLLAIAALLYVYSHWRSLAGNSGLADVPVPTNPQAGPAGEARERVDRLANAIAIPGNPAEVQPGAELDSISLALNTIDQQPKPDMGNVSQARELQAQALEYARRGDFERAYPLFTSAHQLAPGEDMIEVMLAMTEMRIGREADAQRHLIEALNINPRNDFGWRALGDLAIMKGNGSADSIKQASEYYLAAWWFASDRKKLLQALDSAAEASPPAQQAVQQLHAKIRQ